MSLEDVLGAFSQSFFQNYLLYNSLKDVPSEILFLELTRRGYDLRDLRDNETPPPRYSRSDKLGKKGKTL